MPSVKATTTTLSSRASARSKISAGAPVPAQPTKRQSVPPVPLNGHHALVPISPFSDIQISFPGIGRIQIQSPALFSDPHSLFSRQFIERTFLAPEVDSVEIVGSKHRAEISVRVGETPWRELVRKISRLFSQNEDHSDGLPSLVLPPILRESKQKA